MKKVIRGKVYNPSTARRLKWYFNDLVEETLYQKKTGEYFLYKKIKFWDKDKGPYYGYRGYQEGEKGGEIIPLTYEKADSWAIEHLDPYEYVELFGVMLEEGDEKARLNLYVNRQTVTKLKQKASREGKSLSALVEELLDAGLS